ncbi:MAG TPA: DNA integrity scanning diadenylate cyclase DisA, partial [Acidimicrobiales bacterium]|nr:DNA integrity scanning diadenylate cyclase DisA [Acidimicrobiales bacterium]
LREGLDRVLQAARGALVVVSDSPAVLSICTGGFLLDAEFTPQRLSELAKMDGAIILTADASRIARANVHLMPRASIPTSETGTRHRTAERVARSVGVPVVSVSEEMGTITVYRGALRHLLRPAEQLIARSTYLLSTLERFRQRFDEADASLTASEIGDVVTAGEVAHLLQRAEMVLRVAAGVDELLDELGEHGRLLRLQLSELTASVGDERRLVLEDYLRPHDGASSAPDADVVLGRLGDLATDELLGIERFVSVLDGSGAPPSLDEALEPRGLRLLRRVPELASDTISLLLQQFDGLHEIIRAPMGELAAAAQLSDEEARIVKDGLARLASSSILERYR